MAKGKLAQVFGVGYRYLDKIFLMIYFTILRWLVYVATFVGSIFLLENLAYSQSYFLGNMVSMFEASLVVIISFTYIFNFEMMGWFMFSGFRAGMGHMIAGVTDVFFVQLYVVFRIFDTLMYYILKDGTVRMSDGLAIGPYTCNNDGFPNYQVKDIKVIGSLLGAVNDVLDYTFCVGFGTILEVMHLGGLKSIPAVGTALNQSYCAPQVRSWPVGSQLASVVTTVENQSLIPEPFFNFIFQFADIVFGTLMGDYSGGDLLKHQLYLVRLETGSNGIITGGGSHPFDGYIDKAKLKIMGCPTEAEIAARVAANVAKPNGFTPE